MADDLVTGGGLVVDWMRRSGVTHFFNVPGESFLPVLDALYDAPDITVVTNRHESGASFGAEAYAKLTGRPAVCMATRGPGASNLSIGVQTAYYDSTPMVALLGLIPTRLSGARAFQEFDPASMFGSFSKKVMVVTRTDAIPEVLEEAHQLAIAGRPGPVVVGLPVDILYERTPSPRSRASGPSGPVMAPGKWDPAPVGDLLLAAKRPAVIAATGPLRGPAATSLQDLSAHLGIPLYASWRRFSAIDNGHPNFAGSIALGADPSLEARLAEHDLILLVGFALEQITVQVASLNRADLTLVQLAAAKDPEVQRHVPSARVQEVVVDPEIAAPALSDWVLSQPRSRARLFPQDGFPPRAAVEGPFDDPNESAGDRIQIAHLMREVDRAMPAAATVTSDAGNFGQWLVRHIRFDRERAFLGPLNGAMGYGIPAAIGAQMGRPEAPAWAIAGDGGALMALSELATAQALALDLVVVVVDNGVYGTIRGKQEAEFPGRPIGTELGHVDFAAVARAVGWEAWTIDKSRDIRSVLESVASGPKRCRLVHARVDERPFSID